MEAEEPRRERDRYRELLEESRTVLPGVQVLFAFLLVAPFSQRFDDLDPFGKNLFTWALITAALAMFLFLAPASYHRVAPRHLRRDRIRAAVWLMRVGMPLLAVSVLLAVFVVLRFVLYAGLALAAAGSLAAVVAAVWYLLPLLARLRHHGSNSSAP